MLAGINSSVPQRSILSAFWEPWRSYRFFVGALLSSLPLHVLTLAWARRWIRGSWNISTRDVWRRTRRTKTRTPVATSDSCPPTWSDWAPPPATASSHISRIAPYTIPPARGNGTGCRTHWCTCDRPWTVRSRSLLRRFVACHLGISLDLETVVGGFFLVCLLLMNTFGRLTQ